MTASQLAQTGIALRPTAAERRTMQRRFCSDLCLPTGTARVSSNSESALAFDVIDVCRSGMRLSMREGGESLSPGAQLNANIRFSHFGSAPVRLEVLWVDAEAQPHMQVGVRVRKAPERAHQLAARYLLSTASTPHTFSSLQDAGLVVLDTASVFEFGVARGGEDFSQVLELRRVAYAHAGKLDGEAPPEAMRDEFDEGSVVVVVRCGQRIVASLRLSFGTRGRLPYEAHLPTPPHFPGKDLVVEMSRACTHPEFRSSDLLFQLFRFATVESIRRGARHIAACSMDNLAELYRKLGFRDTGLSYAHPTLAGETLSFMVMSLERTVYGHDVRPVMWNFILFDIYMQCIRERLMPRLPRPRTALYILLRPVALLLRSMRRRARVRRLLGGLRPQAS